MRTKVAAIALGTTLGFLCARVVLVNSALSLIPWALAGVAVGALSNSRRSAAASGAAYGFVLAYVFMLASYDGSAALSTRLLPFLVFGLVGAICGTGLALIGSVARARSG